MILRYSPTGVGPYGGDYPDERPRTRGECFTFPRPCPFVSCRYHMAIDAHKKIDGSTHLRVLNDDPTTMADTCTLDVADGLVSRFPVDELDIEEAAESTLQTVADYVGVSRQNVHDMIDRLQRRIRIAATPIADDYGLDVERSKRGPLEIDRARSLILDELATGPKTRSQVLEAGKVRGIALARIDAARSLLAPIVQSRHDRGGRATWTLVGGRKADLRHSGHPGKARRSD